MNVEVKSDEIEEDKNFAIIPPNGGWGWFVVAGAFYCNVVLDGIQLTFGVFLKRISETFNADYSQVALAGSLIFGMHLLTGPLCAGCINVFGIRPVVITGSLITCFGVAITYFATGCWFLYISYGIVGGVGLGLVYMNTLLITSMYFTTLMPIAIAIVVSGTGVGTMIFAAMGNFLLQMTTWQNSFLMQACLAGSMSIAAITFKPLKPRKVKLVKEGTHRDKASSHSHKADESKTGAVFISREAATRTSISTIQSFVWEGYIGPVISSLQFVGETAPNEFSNRCKRCCTECYEKFYDKCCTGCCGKCCKKYRRDSDDDRVIILSEITSEGTSRRKSYVEKDSTETSKDTTNRTVYTRVNYEKAPRDKPWVLLKKSIITMLDCHLLKSWSFTLFAMSGALQISALVIVYMYEKDRCTDLGYSEDMSSTFIIALGGANTFWRLLIGGIASIPKINHRALAISGTLIGGVATLVSGFSDNVYYQYAFCFFFGLAMACFAVFRIVLLCNIVEPSQMGNATGISLLFMGVSSIISPPFFGLLKEKTKSYNAIFISTGIILLIAGMLQLRSKR